jgi:CRP-like cAMP-binding protein
MHGIVQSFSDRREASGSAHGRQVLHFAPDAEIYGDSDENASFYKVLSGVVRTCKFRSDGRRQIDAFHLPGEIFGFDAGTRHRLSAEAVSDCVVVAYRWRAVEAPGEIDDRLAAQFFGYAMQNLQRAQEHSLLLGRRSASQKVAAFLVEMADLSHFRALTARFRLLLVAVRMHFPASDNLTIATPAKAGGRFAAAGRHRLAQGRETKMRFKYAAMVATALSCLDGAR